MQHRRSRLFFIRTRRLINDQWSVTCSIIRRCRVWRHNSNASACIRPRTYRIIVWQRHILSYRIKTNIRNRLVTTTINGWLNKHITRLIPFKASRCYSIIRIVCCSLSRNRKILPLRKQISRFLFFNRRAKRFRSFKIPVIIYEAGKVRFIGSIGSFID